MIKSLTRKQLFHDHVLENENSAAKQFDYLKNNHTKLKEIPL